MIGNNDINLKIGATDATGTAFKSAEQKMKSFVGMAKGAMGTLGIGLGVGASVSILKNLAGGALAYADSISDASSATQTSTDSLQVFRYMAERSGAKAEQMDKALINMNDSAVQAADGLGAQADSLRTLGINYKAFFAMNSEQRFGAIAAAVKNAANQNVALSAASDLMGAKNAPKLLAAMLEYGAIGMAAALELTKKNGVYLDKEMTAQLDSADRKITDFNNRMKLKMGAPLAVFGSDILGVPDMFRNAPKGFGGELVSQFINPGKVGDAAWKYWVRGDRFTPTPVTPTPVTPAAPSPAGSGFILEPSTGKSTTFGPNGEAMLEAEIKRLGDLNVFLAETLKNTNDKTERLSNQIKTGRN